MNVGKPVGKNGKSMEGDVCYFEGTAVFCGEPVELLEESTQYVDCRIDENG